MNGPVFEDSEDLLFEEYSNYFLFAFLPAYGQVCTYVGVYLEGHMKVSNQEFDSS